MTARIISILALLTLCGTAPAWCDDVIDVATADFSDANALTVDGFTGGVGQSADAAGGAIVIQMLQPATTASGAGNAPSNYQYVRAVPVSSH
jgi:hypothetical protein